MAPMSRRAILKMAGFLSFLLVGSVLVDTWVAPAPFVDPDGDGPRPPQPNPEVIGQREIRNRVDLDLDAPFAPVAFSPDPRPMEAAPVTGDVSFKILTPPVRPWGWLGLRHRRIPS